VRICLRWVNTRACLLAMSLLAAVAPSAARAAREPAASLRISLYSSPFHLTFHLSCEPDAGTLPRPHAACVALAHESQMLFPRRPERSGGLARSCPAPRWVLGVTGTYRGRSVETTFADTCASEPLSAFVAWRSLLPSSEHLDRVRVDRGLGPLTLGEGERNVRSMLGLPSERLAGLDVYRLGGSLGVLRGPAVPELFAVGYDRMRRVDTLVDNGMPSLYGEWPTLTPGAASRVRSWLRVACDRHHVLADRPLLAGRAATIVHDAVNHPAVVVTRRPQAACASTQQLR
jgi:hypothetical protein